MEGAGSKGTYILTSEVYLGYHITRSSPPPQILKVSTEALTRLSHMHSPDGLSITSLRAVSLGQLLGSGEGKQDALSSPAAVMTTLIELLSSSSLLTFILPMPMGISRFSFFLTSLQGFGGVNISSFLGCFLGFHHSTFRWPFPYLIGCSFSPSYTDAPPVLNFAIYSISFFICSTLNIY